MMKDDLASVLFTKEQLAARVQEMGEQITKDYAGKELLAVSVLSGAAVFYTDIIRAIDLPMRLDFMKASSYGNASISTGEVKIKKDLDNDIKGKHVLVVEDIIDTGITMSCLIPLLKKRGAASVKLCALLSKPDRRAVDINIDYLGFTIPDEFVVGYGLDYAEMYRNLPYIGILKREIYS